MMFHFSRLPISAFILSLTTAAGAAQAVPAHLFTIDGTATLVYDGALQRASVGQLVLVGDQLRTDAGRAEVLFGDGSALDLDRHTTIDVIDESLVRLIDGRIRLTVSAVPGGGLYGIHTPAATIRLPGTGEYRVSLLEHTAAVEVAVLRGAATVEGTFGSTTVYTGERVLVRMGEHPGTPRRVASAALDAFDRWAEQQRVARHGIASAPYLPAALTSYASTFARYGTWRKVPVHGHVWHPSVGAGWRPYLNGYWRDLRRYGWTWTGFDPWTWPTHHFGRWRLKGGAWFWIPGRRWAPAWVSWGASPGLVGWRPTNVDGRSIIDVPPRTLFRARTLFGSRDPFRPLAPDSGLYDARGAYDPGAVWTLVPRRVFGDRLHVQHHAVDSRRLAPGIRNGFVRQASGPRQTTPERRRLHRVTIRNDFSWRTGVPRRTGEPRSRIRPARIAVRSVTGPVSGLNSSSSRASRPVPPPSETLFPGRQTVDG